MDALNVDGSRQSIPVTKKLKKNDVIQSNCNDLNRSDEKRINLNCSHEKLNDFNCSNEKRYVSNHSNEKHNYSSRSDEKHNDSNRSDETHIKLNRSHENRSDFNCSYEKRNNSSRSSEKHNDSNDKRRDLNHSDEKHDASRAASRNYVLTERGVFKKQTPITSMKLTDPRFEKLSIASLRRRYGLPSNEKSETFRTTAVTR